MTVVAMALSACAATVGASQDDRVSGAIARAIRLRMGTDVEVSLVGLRVVGSIEQDDDLQAVPAPGAKVGGPMKFVLRARQPGSGRLRAGRAEAVVTVRALHARAARDVARGTVLADEDVEVVLDSVGRMPLQPVPQVAPGMKALRNIRKGDLLLAKLFSGAILVKAGDEVLTRISVDGVEAIGRAIAAQSGRAGRVIRVVNPDSGKRMRGRVVGEREVEVLHGS